VGSSLVNPSDLAGLRRAWRERRLVLFLGAGVSTEWGIPSWKNLVLELLFDQTAQARRMRGMWPHYRRALSEWLIDHFEYNPVILARVVKTDAADRDRDFRSAVRDQLYASYERAKAKRSAGGSSPTTLDAVVTLLERSGRRGHVRAVVTFNFDDLLEQSLAARGLPFQVIHDDERPIGHGIPIVHPHGFLPMTGPLPQSPIVFTEDEYHHLTDSVFHWALTRIVGYLRESTVLFVGLSMSDPSLRRLLDASHRAGTRPDHWQVQRRHAVGPAEKPRVMQMVAERARQYGAILGDEEMKDTEELSVAIDAVLRQADTYDRRLFEAMGIKTIWLDDYADLPALLGRIGARA
jgi:hypothetical protein